MKPGAQVHVPEAEHVPELAQDGEQVADCMSRSAMAPAFLSGSWARSGTESHNTTRPLDPKDRATHMLEDRAKDSAARGVDEFDTGPEGRELNAAFPE